MFYLLLLFAYCGSKALLLSHLIEITSLQIRRMPFDHIHSSVWRLFSENADKYAEKHEIHSECQNKQQWAPYLFIL